MFEKVNPSHPDKIADRIASALVDYAYTKQDNPQIAVEVLLGHGDCHVIAETSVHIPLHIVTDIVDRICTFSSPVLVDYKEVPQDSNLAKNQKDKIRCGDNGIFRGSPITFQQSCLAWVVRGMYAKIPSDGKYLIDNDNKITVCQSGIKDNIDFKNEIGKVLLAGNSLGTPGNLSLNKINPLGNWTGGIGVDCGATNRKLGSDMGDGATGGGYWGKDLSKGDISISIYAFLKAQNEGHVVEVACSIGDEYVDGKPYSEIVETARQYVRMMGGFEKLSEWGFI